MSTAAPSARTETYGPPPAVPGVKFPDRQSAPGTADKNIGVISEALSGLLNGLPRGSRVLEVAAGHGQLTERLGNDYPHLSFVAAEADDVLIGSIRERCSKQSSFGRALVLDFEAPADDPSWRSVQSSGENDSGADVAFVVNVVHIVPWSTVEGVFSHMGRVVKPGGRLCLYGAYNEENKFTSEGNERVSTCFRETH